MTAMRIATLLLLSAFLLPGQVKITPGPEKIAIEINGKPFTDFYIAGPEVAKPYLWPLRAATGTYVTRAWPMEKVEEEASIARPDHPHQRGLWFAHAKVNDLDFWNIAPLDQKPYNQPDRGKIVLSKVGEVKSGKDKGSIAAVFNWTDHDRQNAPHRIARNHVLRGQRAAHDRSRHHADGGRQGDVRRREGRRARHPDAPGASGGQGHGPHHQRRRPGWREGALGQAVELVRLLGRDQWREGRDRDSGPPGESAAPGRGGMCAPTDSSPRIHSDRRSSRRDSPRRRDARARQVAALSGTASSSTRAT